MNQALDVSARPGKGAVIGGWLCFGLGLLFMYFSLITFFVYIPLFVASFALAIVSIAQKRIAVGIPMLIVTLVVPPVMWTVLAVLRVSNTYKQVSERATELGLTVPPLVEREVVVPEEALTPKGEKVKKSHPLWSNEICNIVAEKRVRIGMTKLQVIAAWKKPYRINTTYTSSGTHEQWVMSDSITGSYLYFENDKLTSANMTEER